MGSPSAAATDEKVAIVGMGPGGMATALALAKKGKKVTLFEKREAFTRTQKVALTSDTEKFINDLVVQSLETLGIETDGSGKIKKGDIDQMLEKLRSYEGYDTPEGKKMEAELLTFKRLLEDSHKGLKLNELQKFLKICIEWLYPDQIEIKIAGIEGIDPENHSLTYKDEQGHEETMAFDHLVAADGAAHNVANMVKRGDDFDLGHDSSLRQTRQKAHGTVRVALDKDKKVEQAKPLDISALPELRKLGWDKPYLPSIYIWEDKQDNEYYIAGEIPSSILNASPEERVTQMREWGQKLVELTTSHEPQDLSLPDNLDAPEQDRKAIEKLSTTAFPVTMTAASKAAIELRDGHAFFSVGDAARTANFHLGHGTNDAIADGILVAECIAGSDFPDIDRFNDSHNKRREKINNSMDGISIREMKDQDKTVDFAASEISKSIDSIKQYLSKVPSEQRAPLETELDKIKTFVENKELDKAFEATLNSLGKIKDTINTVKLSESQKSDLTTIGIAICNKICKPLARFLEKMHLNNVQKAESKAEETSNTADFVGNKLSEIRSEVNPSAANFCSMDYSKQKAFIAKATGKRGRISDDNAGPIIGEISSFIKRDIDKNGLSDAKTLIAELSELRGQTISQITSADNIDKCIQVAVKFSPYDFDEEQLSAIKADILKAQKDGIDGGENGYATILDAVYKNADLSTLNVDDVRELSSTQLGSIIKVSLEKNGKEPMSKEEIKEVITSIQSSKEIETPISDVIDKFTEERPGPDQSVQIKLD